MIHLLAFVALGTVVCDLALKLVPLGEQRVLLPGVLGLAYAQNRGVAFGLLNQSPLVSLLVSLALVLLGGACARGLRLTRPEALGAGLMLGGALGNLTDRALHGAVSDYLQLLLFRFPLFNLADACLTLGALLLALCALLPGGKARHV
ncbi:MAG: signal peptidase II [Christensenellales bacterium]|jgi:signal peptidase II